LTAQTSKQTLQLMAYAKHQISAVYDERKQPISHDMPRLFTIAKLLSQKSIHGRGSKSISIKLTADALPSAAAMELAATCECCSMTVLAQRTYFLWQSSF